MDKLLAPKARIPPSPLFLPLHVRTQPLRKVTVPNIGNFCAITQVFPSLLRDIVKRFVRVTWQVDPLVKIQNKIQHAAR